MVARLTSAARLMAVIAVVVLLQVALVAPLHFVGVSPDIVLLASVAAGVAAGPDRGAITGFVAGLGYDLFLQTPLGMTALVYALVSFGAGAFQLPLATHPRWWRVGCVVLTSALGVLGYVAAGLVLGQDGLLGAPVLRIVVVVALVNGVLALPAVRLLGWVWGPAVPERLGV